MGDLIARFVDIPARDVDSAIEDCQRQLVEALKLDRSTLYQLSGGDLHFTHQWTRPEHHVTPPPHLSMAESFPWYFSKLSAGETVIVPNIDDIPSPLDRENVRRFGARANVAVPLEIDGVVVGVATYASMAVRSWEPAIVERLQLLSGVFAHALARKRANEELQAALAEVKALRDGLARDNVLLHQEVKQLRRSGPIPTESVAAQRVLVQVEQVAPTNATVLLLGETGCGKEMFAQAIHDRSPRRHRPMVRISCAAIPTALIESELFGRERGAYTGAVSRQIGRFELADGSTIFLDEIGELPLESQVKLLRVLQDRVVERLGSAQPIKVDVRIIAATNRNLEEAVAARTFREDLYYRLKVFPITVPPLRERVEDIPSLVWSFVDEFSRQSGKRMDAIAKDSMAALQRYAWPGNIRELRNVIEHAMIVATGPTLVVSPPAVASVGRHRSLRIADVEAEHIRTVLDSTSWRVRGAGGAAELLGIKPTTLEGRMAKLGIRRGEKRT